MQNRKRTRIENWYRGLSPMVRGTIDIIALVIFIVLFCIGIEIGLRREDARMDWEEARNQQLIDSISANYTGQ